MKKEDEDKRDEDKVCEKDNDGNIIAVAQPVDNQPVEHAEQVQEEQPQEGVVQQPRAPEAHEEQPQEAVVEHPLAVEAPEEDSDDAPLLPPRAKGRGRGKGRARGRGPEFAGPKALNKRPDGWCPACWYRHNKWPGGPAHLWESPCLKAVLADEFD